MSCADFECVLKKISSCEPDNKRSFTVKTEKHEPWGFSYVVVRSDGTTLGPFTYRGEDTVFLLLSWLQNHESQLREEMANKKLLFMTNEDWQKHRNAVERGMRGGISMVSKRYAKAGVQYFS